MSQFDGDVAIVTGAAQGIGAAYASALARDGARVVATDILDPAPLVATIAKAGGEAIGVMADVTDAASVGALVARTLARFGRIDILVNNAALFGDLKHSRFEDIEEDEWDAVMRVDICVNAVAPGLTLSEGVVENGHWSEEWIDRNVASRALKRRAVPEDLVGSVLFLASRDANFVTGQTMVIDGGAVAH